MEINQLFINVNKNDSYKKEKIFLRLKMILIVTLLISNVGYAANVGDIVITEIMYNALSSESDNEYFEIYNTTNAPIDLTNWEIRDDEDGVSSNLSGTIPAFGIAIIFRGTQAAFQANWSTSVMVITSNFNSTSNSPSATNEIYQIIDNLGNVIDEVNYDDDAITWPGDEDGVSIYLDRTTTQIQSSGASDNDNGCNWSESKNGDDGAYTASDGHVGSPGIITVDSESGVVVITEILYNPVSPEANQEWIEIANTTSSTVDLTGWTFGDIEDGLVLSLSGSIPAYGIAIISNQGQSDFQGAWSVCGGGIQVVTVSAGPSLSNSATCAAEKLQIRDNSGNLSDEVNYEGSGTWPTSGSDASIALNLSIDQIRSSGASDNNNGNNWILSTSDLNACANVSSGNFAAGSTASPGLIQGSSSLPVELISFKVESKGDYNFLSWQTANELDNLGFEVQKSKDGRYWELLTLVKGQGTSTETNKYNYQDNKPFSGINYYRLKQIDFDGAFEFSKVITVDFNNVEKHIHVFPNPSNGLINLQINNSLIQKMKVKISDNFGRRVWESELIEGESNWRRAIEILDNGIYFLSAQIGDEVFYERILVTNKN